MGDLETSDAAQAYDQEVLSWKTLLNISPSIGICDLHPGYYTSHYLQKTKMTADKIQHHKAHVYSGMLDNSLSPPFLGVSWDGTGFGEDQTIWGAETFIVKEDGMRRFASLFPFRLPGSEKAIKEPRRTALGVLHAIFGKDLPSIYHDWAMSVFSQEELKVLSIALDKGINAPICSSMGRLFDAVSALVNCCTISDFEGHAALSLEALALKTEKKQSRYTLSLYQEKGIWLMDWKKMVQQICQDKANAVASEEIAFAFHLALARTIILLAQKASLEKVLLTGGVMQNKLLAENTITALREAGFQPYWHHQIPPNDGGISAGQIMGHYFESKWREKCV
jgi:hydrogenase maturation protein HypF